MLSGIRRLFRYAFANGRERKLRSAWERTLFPAGDAAQLREMARWCRLLLLGHAALALAFVATGNWILVLLVTFAPYLATWFKIVTHVP